MVVRRANECIVSITESDYKNLNKNDIEDIYLLIMNGKVPDYAETESYQQKVNLTAPTISSPGIEKHEMFSIIYEPVHGIIYKNSKKEKRVMRHSEIHKFCDATLNRVFKGLKSYNNDVKYGYKQRDLTEDEVEYLKLFEEEIKVRLKYRNQMRRWEIYVNRKPWCIAGDMNVILQPNEQSCGPSIMSADMMDFQDCLNTIKVKDICIFGLYFTWTKNLHKAKVGIMTGALKKLDRIMFNEGFIKDFPQAHAKFLPYDISDHTLLFYVFHLIGEKLKRLKVPLKRLEWSKWNLFKRVECLRKQLQDIQISIDADPYDQSLWWRNSIRQLFLKHFENFLGSTYPVQEVESSETLSLFDIKDTKAHGPDGFTAAFFKQAWSIVGADTCTAVKEFFTSGKMLGELNTTLVSLIPKVQTPDKEFLKKVLNGFKFHEKMVIWIMQCVTTVAFTLNVNGDRIRYFKGGRGLRQGDLISLYLFTLIMEIFSLILLREIDHGPNLQYHFRCKDIKMSYVYFADDLFFTCHGDATSVGVIKKALDAFSACSGLVPNNSNSTAFFRSMNEEESNAISFILPFVTGKLHVKYLGVPLIAKRLGVRDCGCLWDKIKRKKETLWVKWVHSIKLRGKSIWEVSVDQEDSWGWKNLLGIRDQIKDIVVYKIGNGSNVSMWFNNWSEIGPLF
ncbi:RNA-directed DNA polymerase, eukaryota, reverse transcriptase zinc-binding domain protein [Tanacetum coccineum]